MAQRNARRLSPGPPAVPLCQAAAVEGSTEGSDWSWGRAAAFAIRLWKSFSATWATASSSCSSLHSTSRASSSRCAAGGPSSSEQAHSGRPGAPPRGGRSSPSCGPGRPGCEAKARGAGRPGVLGDRGRRRRGSPTLPARSARGWGGGGRRREARGACARKARSAGEPASTPTNLDTDPPGTRHAGEQPGAVVRRGELVVDIEAADVCLHGHGGDPDLVLPDAARRIRDARAGSLLCS